MTPKMKRRLILLDDLLDYALSSTCRFFACNGPEAPIRNMQTCFRCTCIHRAIQMGLVKKVKKTYERTGRHGNLLVFAGVLEQFSAVDGKRYD